MKNRIVLLVAVIYSIVFFSPLAAQQKPHNESGFEPEVFNIDSTELYSIYKRTNTDAALETYFDSVVRLPLQPLADSAA